MKRDLDLMTLPLGLRHELVIDNFCGSGGASRGMEMAFGRPVDIAINHDPVAIFVHEANHPDTTHYREDVFDVDPVEATGNQPVGLVWLSPACPHHSKARGGKPLENRIRALAWVGRKWAGKALPRCLILENVEEYEEWTKLIAKRDKATGRVIRIDKTVAAPGERVPVQQQHLVADRRTKGSRFRAFVRSLEDMGYCVEFRPLPPHGHPASEAVRSGRLKPWRTVAECIDWSLPCPSIFGRKRPLVDATLRRVARGIMKFVVNAERPFIVPVVPAGDGEADDSLAKDGLEQDGGAGPVCATLIQTGYGERASQAPRVPGLDKPLGTAVASGVKHAVVVAFLAKHYGGHESPGSRLDGQIGAVTTKDHHALVTAHLQRDFGQSVGSAADEPAGTITAGGRGHMTLVASNIVKLRGTNTGQPTDQPLQTISAGGIHHYEVRALLERFVGASATPDGACSTPLGTVRINGELYAIVDIGMRGLTPPELARAQGFPESYLLDPVFKGKRVSKTAQIRMIGNSVCPELASALVAANFAHEKALLGVAA